MNETNNLILVTDWDKVEADDFYLIDEKWAKQEGYDDIEKFREFQKEGNLYYGYIVDAVHYAIYKQMDADQVFIDRDGNVLMYCESAIISSPMEHAEEYDY